MLLFALIGGLVATSPLRTYAIFSDVTSNHNNAEAIQYVFDQKIVSGYPDGSFGPDKEINRAELAKILIEASSPGEAVGRNCFSDVRGEWFAPYVCFAGEKDIVQGYPNGSFQPEQPVNFVEAAKMIGMTFNLDVTDDSQPWYRPYVSSLESQKAIPLSIYSFDQRISRGEMAEMIYRLRASVRGKPSRTFAQLEIGESNGSREQTPGQESCVSADSGKICSKSLFLLPRPLKEYRTDGADSLHLLTDANDQQSIFYIENRFRDRRLFVNGKYEGVFDRFAAATSADGDAPLVVFGSGDNLFRSNRWADIRIDSKIQNDIIESIERRIWPSGEVGSIEEAVTKFEEREQQSAKTTQQYLKWSDEQVQSHVATMLEFYYPTELRRLIPKMQKGSLTLTELFRLLHYRGSNEKPFRDIFISSVFSRDAHHALIFVSLSGGAWALEIADGKLIGLFPAYAPWSNSLPVAYEPTSGVTAFRAVNPKARDRVGSEILSGKSMWLDGKLGESYNVDISFPRLSKQGDILYIGVNAIGDEKNYSVRCTAVVGEKTHNFPCNDPLFFRLIANTTAFRFPRVSPDGKTVVYPELISASEAKDDWLYPEEIFTSRLVVNGKTQETHPWIDFPYFTNKGLAVVTHSDNNQGYVDSYVEWNGKKAGPFQSLLPQLASSTDFRGYPPLFQAVHGDVGDDDLPDEIIVSPDGAHVAFSGYEGKSGWTLYKDMNRIASFDHVPFVAFSSDSKKLAYVGVSIDRSKPEPGVQVGEYRLIQMPFERAVSSEVIVDGQVLGKHENVLWIGFSPIDSSLFYIARGNNEYRLFRNGKPIGERFDALVMEPAFSSEGILQFGVVNGPSVTVVRLLP